MSMMELTADEEAEIRAARTGQPPPDKPKMPTVADFATQPFGQYPPPNPPNVQRIPDVNAWVDKQQRGATTVGPQNYLDGIRTPRKDPIQAGIDAQPAYVAAMRDPAVLARRATALGRTNMNEWAAKAEAVGVSRYADGVVASKPKLQRGVQAYHDFLASHLANLDRMPSATTADRDRKVLANLQGLRGFKNQRG